MSTTLERLQYGYDRNSRRTWRRRALTTGEDNAYGYDGLSQVTQSALGNLNQNCTAISAVPASEETWDYDPTGNWRGYRVEVDGSVSLDQGRVHDKGNRLTQIEDDPYTVVLDRVGRVRQVSPDASGDWDESQKIKWDAWGRVTQVKRANDDTVLGVYAYDGLTRRTTRAVNGVAHHCYYSDQWRPLEERKDSQTTAELHYYWGARHRDDLARRDRATIDGGSLDETRYVLMDYFNPAAITDAVGILKERYAFSAFGIRRILAPDFTPRSTSECGFELGFQGQFLDTESGFLNYGYRYYSLHAGRWLSKDPIMEHGGINLYGFAANSPTNSVDKLGLSVSVTNVGDHWFISVDAVICSECVDINGDGTKRQRLSEGELNLWATTIKNQFDSSFTGSNDLSAWVSPTRWEANLNISVRPKGKCPLPALRLFPQTILIKVTNNITGDDPNSEVLGRTPPIGGKQIFLNYQALKSDFLQLARTGAHELGHALTLRHPNDPLSIFKEKGVAYSPENLMLQSVLSSGTIIEDLQIYQIIQNYQ
jgi:RHS repeat-associated protein